MMKNEITRRNPLKLMGYDAEDILNPGDFGAITARAGVGKTAFLVQLALDKLLRNLNVLHISLGEPVEKVCLWYEEVFRNLAFDCNIKYLDPFWDAILPNRFIMTFKAESFSAERLQERLTDLTEQDIFFPRMMLIDGLFFDENTKAVLVDLKKIANELGIGVWFSVRTHRHESPRTDSLPPVMNQVADLFDVVLQLQPEGKDIFVRALKGAPRKPAGELILDPATLLVRNPVKQAVSCA
ncbi:MAG: cytoplasmic protein [Desulfococcaceae bacterium]|nr:cytoplasmic protein [Desulfococcaceae bacterium]